VYVLRVLENMVGSTQCKSGVRVEGGARECGAKEKEEVPCHATCLFFFFSQNAHRHA